MQAGPQSTFLFARIVVAFGLLLGSYYAFAATELYQSRIFQPYVEINADLSGRILSLVGYQISVHGNAVRAPEFSLSIASGCDGLEPTALFVAAVLAFAAPTAKKLSALAVGIPLLVSLNLVRIVSLFLVGVHYPDLFHTMHVDVWQVLYILVAMVFFALWLLWATRRSEPIEADSG